MHPAARLSAIAEHLVYKLMEMPSYVTVYRSYKLQNMVRFLAHTQGGASAYRGHVQ